VKLTDGNVGNHHFYLRECASLIPDGGIGGKNKTQPGVNFTVRFQPGPTVETDVAGDKMIFRCRGAMREFLEASAAIAGDRVVIERSGDRQLTIWLEPAIGP